MHAWQVEILAISSDELNEKLCQTLLDIQNINQNDTCTVFVYLKIKQFCDIDITSDEKVMAEKLVSQKYKYYG